jgi:tetratricopeptide (TPR) repeat protein
VAVLLSGLPVSAQNKNTPPQPKTKKLPPGAKGFESYAGRDASDKLVTGGATRGGGLMSKAAEAMKRGNDAFKAAQEAVEGTPKDQVAAKFQEAVEAYKQAAALQPDLFRAYYMLGGAYEELGQYKEAADAYRHAVPLKLDPEMDDPRDIFIAYYNLGNSLANLGQHKEAIDAYMEIVKRVPDAAKPYYNIGLSYVALNDQPNAIKTFQEAVRLFKQTEAANAKNPDYTRDPAFELSYYNLGLSYSKLEQYTDAAEAFRQAVALNPDHAEARYNLGVVYYMLDNRQGLLEQKRALDVAKSPLAKELASLVSQ